MSKGLPLVGLDTQVSDRSEYHFGNVHGQVNLKMDRALIQILENTIASQLAHGTTGPCTR